MKNDKYLNKYRIPSARAPWHDYNGGEYFITICTNHREHYFGEIRGDEMLLSDIGKYAVECIENVSNHFTDVQIPLFVVMPNHLHLIVIIDDHCGVVSPVEMSCMAPDEQIIPDDYAIICRDAIYDVSTGDETNPDNCCANGYRNVLYDETNPDGYANICRDAIYDVSTGDETNPDDCCANGCRDVLYDETNPDDYAIICRDAIYDVSTGDETNPDDCCANGCRDVLYDETNPDGYANICRDAIYDVSTGGTGGNAQSLKNEKMQTIAYKCGRLSHIISNLKSVITRYAHQNRMDFGWQTRFHDHIVRDQEEMNRIADYISNNVARWKEDKFYSPAKRRPYR